MGKSWRSPDIYTPQMEAHWAKVLGAARRREDTDPAAWSIDLVADPSEPAIAELIKKTQAFMKEAHGPKPKVSRYGMPIRKQMIRDDNGEEQPSGMVILKLKEETRDGAKRQGPIVVDSQNNPWPQNNLIGNGSICCAKFHYFAWDRGSEGVGLSAELHAVQVVQWQPYEAAGSTPTAGFAPVEGGIVMVENPPEVAFGEIEDEFAKSLREAAEALVPDQEEIPF